MRHSKHSKVWVVLVVLLAISALLLSSCSGSATPAATSAPAAPAAQTTSTAPAAAPQATRAPAAATTSAAAAPAGQVSDAAKLADQRGYILIGRPNPTTGGTAGSGEGTPWSEQHVIDAVNKDGGIFIKELNKKLPVKLKVVDTESDTSKAGELTTQLILQDKVDMVVVLHTPAQTNPVSAACERYQIPCVVSNVGIEAWLVGGPYKWSFCAFEALPQQVNTFMNAWEMGETNKTVGLLLGNDGDGTALSKIIPSIITPKGYKIVETGLTPFGTKDFSTMVNKFKAEGVEIVYSNTIAPDTANLVRQMRSGGFYPKVATLAKGILYPADVNAIGEGLQNGLCTDVFWGPTHPFKSSLTGQSAKELWDEWAKAMSKQPAASIGYKHAATEIAVNAIIKAQSLDKAKIREALAATQYDSIVGPIKFNEKNYCETPVVTGQWQKGTTWPWELNVVNNKTFEGVPTTAKIIFPIPH